MKDSLTKVWADEEGTGAVLHPAVTRQGFKAGSGLRLWTGTVSVN